MTATLLAALLAAPTWACDSADCEPSDEEGPIVILIDRLGEDDEDESRDSGSDDDVERPKRHDHDDKGYLALRGDYIGMGQRTTWGASLRGQGKHDGWIGAEGRWADDGAWMGRFGLGLDVFGHSAFDLGLGLVAGHLGDWQTPTNQRFSVGTELVVGWHPGRFLVEHRHLGGARPGGGLRTEGHTRLGFRPLEKVELALDWATIDPGHTREHGFGASLGLRF